MRVVFRQSVAMTERLSLAQISILCAYAFGMAGGQILFKLAALRVSPERPFTEGIVSLLQNGYFLSALAVFCPCCHLGVDPQLYALVAGLSVRGARVCGHAHFQCRAFV
jgi:hypothetical protein